MLKYILLASAVSFAAMSTPLAARAHGGGLDANGCHHDRKNGSYHCHRGRGGGQSAHRLVLPRSLKAFPPPRQKATTPTAPKRDLQARPLYAEESRAIDRRWIGMPTGWRVSKGPWIAAGLGLLALYYCTRPPEPKALGPIGLPGPGGSIEGYPTPRWTSDVSADAETDAVADLAGTTFTDVGDSTSCTFDCGGHDAGYDWAQENEVTDPSDCGGNSASFIEGCEAYGEEIQRRIEQAEEATTEN
jgi:hypothetical protein